MTLGAVSWSWFAAAVMAASVASAELSVPEGFDDDLEVRLVQVDVAVTDRQGGPVRALTREDFSLRVDGSPVEIEYFEEHGVQAAAPQPLQLLVYVDRAFLDPGSLAAALPQVRRFLAEGLPPESRVALVSGDHRLDLHAEFSDPQEAANRLERLPASYGRGRVSDREYSEILRAIVRGAGTPADTFNVDPDGASRSALSRIASYAGDVEREVEATATLLTTLCDTLAGQPGRRAILVLGGRPPLGAGQALLSAWRDAYGRGSAREAERMALEGSGGSTSVAAVPADVDGASDTLLARAAVHAAQRGIAIHVADLTETRRAFDAVSMGSAFGSGQRNQGALAQSRRETSRRQREQRALEALATGTGGRFMAKGRRLEGVLADLSAELASYYTLAFTPRDTERRSGEIEVRLPGRRKAEVRYRGAYRLRSLDRAAAERTLTALLLGPEGAASSEPFDFEVVRGELVTGEEGQSVLPLTVRVPFARLALVPSGRRHTGRLSIFAAVGGLEVGVAPVRKAVVPVSVPNQELLTSQGRQIEYRFDLPVAGLTGRLAITVRDDLADEATTRVLPLEEPPEALTRRVLPAHPLPWSGAPAAALAAP